MHKYGFITLLPFSHKCPITAQRQPNGKLGLLVDLRKINSLIPHDYTNNNLPVSNLSNVAHHLAGKSLFFILDYSQAYHCLQLVDQRSVEMLAFIFASRTFLTKDLRKSSADLCLLFQVSCPSTWTQLSKLTKVLNMWTTLEWQPKCCGLHPEISGSLQVHSPSSVEIDNREAPFRSQKSWIPRKNDFTRRNLTKNSESPQFAGQT